MFQDYSTNDISVDNSQPYKPAREGLYPNLHSALMDPETEHMTDSQLGKRIEEILFHGLQVETDVRTTVDDVCQFVLHSSFSKSLLHSLSNVCNDQSQASPMLPYLLSSICLSPNLTLQRTEIVRLVSDMMVRWAVRCEDRTRGMGQARAVKHLLCEVGHLLCLHHPTGLRLLHQQVRANFLSNLCDRATETALWLDVVMMLGRQILPGSSNTQYVLDVGMEEMVAQGQEWETPVSGDDIVNIDSNEVHVLEKQTIGKSEAMEHLRKMPRYNDSYEDDMKIAQGKKWERHWCEEDADNIDSNGRNVLEKLAIEKSEVKEENSRMLPHYIYSYEDNMKTAQDKEWERDWSGQDDNIDRYEQNALEKKTFEKIEAGEHLRKLPRYIDSYEEDMKHLREAVTRSKTATNISVDSDNDLMALSCLQLEGCREKPQEKAPLLLSPSAFSDPRNPSEQDKGIYKSNSSPILGYLIRQDDGNVFTVTDVCLVGRGHQCQVKLSGNKISRQHARIIVDGEGQVVIQPLSQAKRKKVRVNSDEILEEHILEDGDTLQVGSEIFKWKMKVMNDKDQDCGQVFTRRKVPLTPSSLQVHVNDSVAYEDWNSNSNSGANEELEQ